MTLVDIKNILFSHFLTETTFNLNEDLASIKLDFKDLDESVANNKTGLFRAALEDFVKSGILVNIGDGLYILSQPIDAFNQNLTLAPVVAEMVGDLINDVGTELGMTNYTANKLGITSDDIGVLCQMVHLLLEEGIESSSKEKS